MILKHLFRPYMKPAGDDGTDTGGADDRGDDWTPTEDDLDTALKDAEKEDKGDEDDDKPEPKAKAKAKDAEEGEDDDDKTDDDKSKAKAKAKVKGKDDAEAGEEDEDEEGEDKPKRKDGRIPMSRHKAILEKERAERKAAEDRLKQYEQGDRVAATNEAITKTEEKILALDKEYAKLMVDGEHEKAAEKRAEIRRLENEIIERKSDMKAQIATSRAIEKVRYDTAVERLEAAYPVLNEDHDDYDADKAAEVVDLSAVYRARGMTPADAIQKAAKTLLGAATSKQKDATEVSPRVTAKEAEAEAKKLKEAERRRSQVEKNLDANKRQPADTSKVGADSDKGGGGLTAKDVMKMSHDDFSKLDVATLSRLRGDTLA